MKKIDENRKVYIYILIDPRDGLVKYVGRSYNLKYRLAQHTRVYEPRTKKERWINSLNKQGLCPDIVSIHTTNEVDWEFWEMHYISLFRSFGYDLTNANFGGNGGYNPNEETRKKMVDHMRNASDIHRNRLSESSRGRKYSQEQRDKLADCHKHQNNSNLRIAVVQLDKNLQFIKEWVSLSEASRGLTNRSDNSGSILRAIKRGTNSYGFKWQYSSVYYDKTLLNAVKLAVPI